MPPPLALTRALAVKGGSLNIGALGISAGGLDLTGFDNIITTGNLDANNVSVNNQLSARIPMPPVAAQSRSPLSGSNS